MKIKYCRAYISALAALIGLRGVVLNCGGNWNNAGKAGLWYLNGNNKASNSNSNIGARLSFMSLRKSEGTASPGDICPCPLAKNGRKEHGSVGRSNTREATKTGRTLYETRRLFVRKNL